MGYVTLKHPAAAVLLAAFLFGCATPDPYSQVKVGDTREHVYSLLGSPLIPDRDMTSGERAVVDGAEAATDGKGAETFSIWREGSERFQIVGFDKQGQVTVKRRFFYQNGP